MILNICDNRKRILAYLDRVDEDTFIGEVVIPLFGSQGFQVYRVNSHGPGEHGKDIIFCRYVPVFFETEFIVVQAKAEQVTTSNVTQFSDQVKRALRTKFAPRSGSGDLHAHYAIFMNARKHSNDAYAEFPQLVKSRHVKILSQENVCELIIQTGIAPGHLLKQLSASTPDTRSKEDEDISEVILCGEPAQIDSLLDHRLKLLKDKISASTKELVIDCIHNRWEMDRSWVGTVKPMKWYDTYFEFFTQTRSKYLLEVLEEYTSSTASFRALRHTESVVRKITPELLCPIENEFIEFCARRAISYPQDNLELVLRKMREFVDAGLVKADRNLDLAKKVRVIEKCRMDGNTEKRKEAERVVYDIVHPDRGSRRAR
jgi:hypothetical protein